MNKETIAREVLEGLLSEVTFDGYEADTVQAVKDLSRGMLAALSTQGDVLKATLPSNKLSPSARLVGLALSASIVEATGRTTNMLLKAGDEATHENLRTIAKLVALGIDAALDAMYREEGLRRVNER